MTTADNIRMVGAGAPWSTGRTALPGCGPNHPGAPAPRAFTLLEVLLAVSVFAIVLLSVHGVFYGALRLHNRASLAIENSLPLERTLAILRRDLAGIVEPGGTFFGELQTTLTVSTNTSQSASSTTTPGITAILQGLASPTFYTAAGIISDTVPWGEVSKVYYHLADPTNNTAGLGKDLFRSVTRNLLPTVQEESEDQWLMGGIESILFTFYDGDRWQETWDSTTAATKLPAAIMVQIQLAPADTDRARPEPVELVVPLMVQATTNTTSTTSTNSSTGGGQ